MAVRLPSVLVLCVALGACASTAERRVAAEPAASADIVNPAIDMDGFLEVAQDAAAHRRSRRLTEDQFLALMAQPGTIVLDARSADRYAMLHVAGAVNLPFPDIAIDSLAQALPDKNARILIYCNNNFEGSPVAFATKIAPASLNLSTYATLYGYGYRNVYELGPQVDVAASKLPFAGTLAGQVAATR